MLKNALIWNIEQGVPSSVPLIGDGRVAKPGAGRVLARVWNGNGYGFRALEAAAEVRPAAKNCASFARSLAVRSNSARYLQPKP